MEVKAIEILLFKNTDIYPSECPSKNWFNSIPQVLVYYVFIFIKFKLFSDFPLISSLTNLLCRTVFFDFHIL
jgi:hypothetical protein